MIGRAALIVFLVCIAIPHAASAHQLDEYLQASRISIELGRIVAEVDLTPGVEVADSIIAAIDRDRNGQISSLEGKAYAERIANSLSLEVDGKRRQLTLDAYAIPSLAEMRGGEGIIRLRATATTPSASAGRHQLTFANTHRSDIGEYLINALVPSDERIRITGQSRDLLQHEFKMDYTVSERETTLRLATALPPMLVLLLAAGLYAIVRRSHS